MHRVAPDVEVSAVGAAPAAVLPSGVVRRTAAGSLPTNLGWSLSGLPLSARRTTYDLFHAPAYTAPLWGVRPLVLTVHDVSYARHPEWYPYRIDPLRRAFYAASARRADRIITDSSFSRDEIVAAFAIPLDRIDVVPLGVSAAFSADPATMRELYVLHVGDLHRRRNLSMLLDIVLTLRSSEPRLAHLRLLLAGADLGMLETLEQAARVSPGALEYLGRPSDKALIDLYRRAALFAYPSRYEGFGLPPLEAMACGTPVVASDAGSVPEVVGNAAIVVPVDDARGWRDAVRQVLLDVEQASALGARGIARAATFNWDRTALDTLASYRRAAAAR